MRFLGLDGYRKGWVAVSLADDVQEINYPVNYTDALHIAHDIAMVDMPIGIPQTGYRRCDRLAKRMLGAASSRVFTGARRAFFSHQTQREANVWAKENNEPGVSCQLFCILEKIKQVDAVMTSALQETVHETHPELVFMRLNSGRPLAAAKKTSLGIRQRIELLEASGVVSVQNWLDSRAPHVKIDDVLDACACAIAARDRATRIPEVPEIDEKGLRMEIWY